MQADLNPSRLVSELCCVLLDGYVAGTLLRVVLYAQLLFFIRNKFRWEFCAWHSHPAEFGQNSPVFPKQSAVLIASGEIFENKIQKCKTSILLTLIVPKMTHLPG